MHTLKIENLAVTIDGKTILNDFNLTIHSGETHVIMGPNGVGKSTLSNVIMGSDLYQITEGHIYFDEEDITYLTTDERAKRGLFLAFQNPLELEGVATADFLRAAVQNKNPETFKMLAFAKDVEKKMQQLKIPKDFLTRSWNVGFSGGEKKKMEILSMYVLKPTMVILDEIDSGLDVDSLKIIGENVTQYKNEENCGVLVITHYQRLLEYIKPDFVHVLMNQKIVKTADASLVLEIEQNGYQKFDQSSGYVEEK